MPDRLIENVNNLSTPNSCINGQNKLSLQKHCDGIVIVGNPIDNKYEY